MKNKMLFFIFISLALVSLMGCSNGSTLSSASATGGTLVISPSIITLAPSSSYNFTATGGTPPYNFILISSSGTGFVQSTGLYTAPNTSSVITAEIEATDSASPTNTAMATITISTSASTGTTGGTIEIYQLYSSKNNDYLYSPTTSEGNSSGYSFQQNAFQIYPTTSAPSGTIPLYRCHNSIGTHHFLSTDSGCAGQTLDGALGYFYSPSTGGASGGEALLQYNDSQGSSYDTVTGGTESGFSLQGTLGYAFSP